MMKATETSSTRGKKKKHVAMRTDKREPKAENNTEKKRRLGNLEKKIRILLKISW